MVGSSDTTPTPHLITIFALVSAGQALRLLREKGPLSNEGEKGLYVRNGRVAVRQFCPADRLRECDAYYLR